MVMLCALVVVSAIHFFEFASIEEVHSLGMTFVVAGVCVRSVDCLFCFSCWRIEQPPLSFQVMLPLSRDLGPKFVSVSSKQCVFSGSVDLPLHSCCCFEPAGEEVCCDFHSADSWS